MLAWYVYKENGASGKLEAFNVFDHIGFVSDLAKAARSSEELGPFEDELNCAVFRHFWGRTEYEVILSHCPPEPDGKNNVKIDVRDQLYLNWDHFFGYCWANREELKKLGKKRKSPSR